MFYTTHTYQKKCFTRLMNQTRTQQKISELGLEDLNHLIKSVGLGSTIKSNTHVST